MLAVDTNIFVRLIMDDHPGQVVAARSLLAAGPIWVSKTVLLETNCILESVYGLDTGEIRAALIGTLGFENVRIEDETGVRAALALTLHGVQFADALHLSSRPPGTEFVSLDRTFVRRAKRAGVRGIFDVPALSRS